MTGAFPRASSSCVAELVAPTSLGWCVVWFVWSRSVCQSSDVWAVCAFLLLARRASLSLFGQAAISYW